MARGRRGTKLRNDLVTKTEIGSEKEAAMRTKSIIGIVLAATMFSRLLPL
jgi:hypothetical protein